MRFMVHVEWRARVPGKWFLEKRERTVEIAAKDFGTALKIAQRKYPNSKLTMRTISQ